MEAERIRRAKVIQGFDAEPPRCATCVYFSRGSAKKRKESARRGWTLEKARLAQELHTGWQSSELQHCTFGNFRVATISVCDEWHSKTGERIETESRATGEPQ